MKKFDLVYCNSDICFQGAIAVNQGLPAAKENKTFTPFVTPTTPLPRMQLMPGTPPPFTAFQMSAIKLDEALKLIEDRGRSR